MKWLGPPSDQLEAIDIKHTTSCLQWTDLSLLEDFGIRIARPCRLLHATATTKYEELLIRVQGWDGGMPIIS